MRLKFYKQSAEKFVSRIDPEAFSASGSRVLFPVACHLRLKALATKRGEEFHLKKIVVVFSIQKNLLNNRIPIQL